jgi:hypothetical protein
VIGAVCGAEGWMRKRVDGRAWRDTGPRQAKIEAPCLCQGARLVRLVPCCPLLWPTAAPPLRPRPRPSTRGAFLSSIPPTRGRTHPLAESASHASLITSRSESPCAT